MPTPLRDIRVLDLSRVLAGPWAGQIFADLGADVIKVERPKVGDDTRHWGPPFLKDSHGKPIDDMAAYFLCANRGKRSLAVDISTATGQQLIHQLIEHTDIVLENYKVGSLTRYQLDYEHLSKINPRLIYCSITGFGQTGPRAHERGYDALVQATGGLMSMTGTPDGTVDGQPVKVGVAVTDIFTGLYSAIGCLAALHQREHTGVGEHIDLALFDVQVAVLSNQNMNYLVGGEVPKRMGSAHPNIVPYQVFPTRDGHIMIAVGNDTQFVDLCHGLKQDMLAIDPLFRTNPDRVKNRQVLVQKLTAEFKRKKTQDWVALLEGLNVPCGPINDLAKVFADPQTIAHGLNFAFKGKDHEPIPSVKNPIHFSKTKMDYRRPPPRLGEHTDSILKDILHYDDTKLAELKKKGVI